MRNTRIAGLTLIGLAVLVLPTLSWISLEETPDPPDTSIEAYYLQSTDYLGNFYAVHEGHDGRAYETYRVKIDSSDAPRTVHDSSANKNDLSEDESDPPVTINYLNSYDWNPQIAVDSSGNSYVVWEGYDGNDDEIYWVRIRSSGVSGTVEKISTHADNINTPDNVPQIAVDSSGNSYVVWEGYDGNDSEIYWVKIDAEGTPGTVEKISTHADNINTLDYDPQIAVDSSGNSYVVWEGEDGTDLDIYWVKIDAEGTPGTVQKISTHADNIRSTDWDPQIAVDSSGNSYVVWQGGDENDHEIYWVKVDSLGIPGVVRKTSTHADNITSYDWYPQIAVDSSGNSYVVWQGYDGNDDEIYWVRIRSSGVSGTVEKISTHADNIDGDDEYPQIAVDSSGNSYVVWRGRDGNDYEIYWVKIDPSGVPGIVEEISTHADSIDGFDNVPQIAVDSSGNSYVVWRGRDENDHEIYWVKVDSLGIPGVVRKTSTHADNITSYDWHPQIAVDSSGNSYVVWQGGYENDSEIYWVKMDLLGVLGSVQNISACLDNIIDFGDYPPQIAADASGNYFTWRIGDGDDSEIYWVKKDLSEPSRIIRKISIHADNTNSPDSDPQISVDSSGRSYVVWWGYDGKDWDIYWVRIDSSGAPGTVQKISTHEDNMNNSDYFPKVRADSSGNSYVVWEGEDGTDLDIYWVKIDAEGTPGTVQKISTHVDNITSNDWDPQIAVDSTGNSYVVWQGHDGKDDEIYWVKIDSSCVPGTVSKISNHADNISNFDWHPKIVADSWGTSYVAWWGWNEKEWDIYLVKLDSTGMSKTIEKISVHANNISNFDWYLQIVADSSETSHVVWWGRDRNHWEIYFTLEIHELLDINDLREKIIFDKSYLWPIGIVGGALGAALVGIIIYLRVIKITQRRMKSE